MVPILQHFDSTICFQSSPSTFSNFSCPSFSVVSIKKTSEHSPKKLCAKSGIVENPYEKISCLHNSQNLASHDGKRGVFGSHDCSVKIMEAELKKNDNFGVHLEEESEYGYLPKDLNTSTSQDKENGAFVDNVNGGAEKIRKFGAKSLRDGGGIHTPKKSYTGNSPARNGKGVAIKSQKGRGHGFDENCNEKRAIGNELGPMRPNGLVTKRLNTICSTKCLHYGRRMRAVLEALDVFSNLDEAFMPWEKSLTNKEISIILKEQVRWERAMEIFEWFKRKCCCKVNAIHYNIMFRILGEARRWNEIDKLWDDMGERRIQPINSTYGTLIDVYRKGGRVDRALKWLETMTTLGIEPDEVTTGIVVQMYKKVGDFKKAEEYFSKWSAGNSMEGSNVNGKLVTCKNSKRDTKPRSCLSLRTYNNLIDTYGKAGQLKEACKTFEEMIRNGILPSTVTFNIMLHMFGNRGQLDTVSSLLRRMNDLRCPPDTRTYNILIYVHAKHNDMVAAANYFKEMKVAFLEPDIVSYRTLLYAFSLRHLVVEAEELMVEMMEKEYEIDELTQSAVSRMYVESDMLETAWSWFHRFHLTGNMTSDCYSANIDAFGKHGHVMEAEKVFNCCRDNNKLTVLVFNVMIKAYGISKKCGEACRSFDLMEQYGIVPDRCSYSTLIQTLAGAEMPHLAKAYVRKMQEVGLVDDCVLYSAVISSFARLKKLEVAMTLYEEMTAFGILPDVVVYGIIINAFADVGNVKEVNRCLNSMRSAAVPLNAVICRSLIKLYATVGYLEEAQNTYQMLQSFDAGADPYSSNCMIDIYSRLSMVRQAEVIFQNLKRKNKANEFSYAMMLCMYKRNGRFMEAIQIAQEMKELGLLTDLLSYNNVLNLYASDGRYKEASEIFNHMLASASQPDNYTFKALGIVLLKSGVSREEIAQLELSRKDDAQVGLQKWKAALSSVIKTFGNTVLRG